MVFESAFPVSCLFYWYKYGELDAVKLREQEALAKLDAVTLREQQTALREQQALEEIEKLKALLVAKQP